MTTSMQPSHRIAGALVGSAVGDGSGRFFARDGWDPEPVDVADRPRAARLG